MLQKARDYEPGELVPGTVYQVVRRIGSGGMGTVYDVEDTTIGKRYVLKTLHPQLGTREDLARRMQNEARTLARLNHPNIVDVITAGVTADEPRRPYFVMERLNGQSLRLVLEKKWQLELAHAYHIAIDLLDVLDHAHDKGVIHRDVKPDNIFLHRTAAGLTVTKLLDFGIMSLLDSASRDTAGRFLGTLRYAAPEQLRGDRPTPKVDVYAAGLVLYEMIAGRGPFDDEGDPHRIASAHLHKIPPPLSRYVPVPKELDALLIAVLAKDPDARPRDAFALAASLRNLKRALGATQSGESTESRPTAVAAAESNPLRPAPLVSVRHPSPDGPYVIAPAPESTAAAIPRTTMSGMTPPTTPAVAAGQGTGSARSSVQVVVDRAAPTGSLSPDTPRLARQGTQSFAPTFPAISYPALAEPTPPPVALPTPVGPLSAVRERTASQSDGPHVRNLPSASPVLRRSAIPIMVTAIGVSALLASSAIFVVARHQLASRAAASIEPAASAASLAVPVAAAVVQPSAAQPQPPAESTGAEHVDERAAAPSESASATGIPAPAPRAAPSSVAATPAATSSGKLPASAGARPAAPALRADRPGPGF
jgi:serine/threonine protein kinase